MASVVVIRDALHTAGAVVSAEEARVSQSAGWARATTGLGARTGVVWHGVSTLLASTATTAPSMTVTVAPLHYVGQKAAGEGVYVGASTSTVTVDVAAAPGSNSRIDVVYVMQRDSGSTTSPDASIQGEIGVITGTAGVTPAKPAIPVGAVEVGTVTVPAGATATTGCTIATTCQWTAAIGCPVPVRNSTERDALTKYPELRVARLDNHTVEMTDGSSWFVESGKITRQYDFPRGADGTFAATVDTGLVNGTITAAPAGEWRLDLCLVMRGGTLAGGTISIKAGTGSPPPVVRTAITDVDASPNPRTTASISAPFTWTGGDMNLVGSAYIGSGTTTVYAVGSYITATYLGPK